MRGQFRAATRVDRSGLGKVFLALTVSIVQVAVSASGQVQAGSTGREHNPGLGIIQMAQSYAGDPGNPVRIREIPVPKPDGTSKADPGNPTPTKEEVPPPSTTENTTPTHATDKPE
jgi:hypothetical protein